MSEPEHTVAILFADICGSTELFEETGNLKALGMIGECLDQLAEVAKCEGGNIIRSKGDDLLCTFDESSSALRAANQMTEEQFPNDLQIHVGIHFGPVINARGDIFGDAVNVAARMLALANPGEILATEDFAAMLPRIDQRSMRLLEQRAVKGKSDPMNIYSVITHDPETTQFYLDTSEHIVDDQTNGIQALPRIRLTLVFHGRKIVRDEDDHELVLGRSEHCDLVVGEPCVSREHAAIRVVQGKVMLTDRSSTGTYILP